MPTNTNVQRLAMNRNAAVTFTIPQLPQMPDAVMRRFPEMRNWQIEMEEWRARFQAVLKAQLANLKAQENE